MYKIKIYNLITLDTTRDIVAHCISWRVSWPMANSKVVQKSAQNLKIMQLAIRLFWSG